MIPTDIAGCKLWLDASDAATVTIVGGKVTQWYDKTSWGQFLRNDQDVYYQANLGTKYVISCPRVVNQNNSMRSKIADGMPAWVLNSSNNTVIMLQRRLSSALAAGASAVFYKNGEGDSFSANGIGCYYNNTLYQWRRWFGADQMNLEQVTPSLDIWGVVALVRNSGNASAYVNNVVVGTDTYSDISVMTPDSIVLGNNSGTDAPGSNEFAEVLVYDSALSTANMTALYNYLMAKWYGGGWLQRNYWWERPTSSSGVR